MSRPDPHAASSRILPKARAAGLLLTALLLGAPLSAQEGPSAELRTALALHDRGKDAAAADALLAAAAAIAGRATAAADGDCIAAEGALALMLQLHAQTGGPSARIDDALRLRQSPLGQLDPAFADQVGLHCLQAMRARGEPATAALARELGCVQDLWVLGPFDNERGAAFARKLPDEGDFDPDTRLPGKLREVSWRRLPGMAPGGAWMLDAVLRPREQVAALVAFGLNATSPTVAALHLGTSGAFEVYCNGASVARRDVDRRFEFDQDVAALPLAAGTNLVVVKVCHQEQGPFAVSLRLAQPAGGPLQGVVCSAEPADMQAAPTPAGLPTELQLRLGARSRVAPAAARGMDAMWLSLLWLLRAADGEGARTDRQFAEAAVRDLPQLPQARMLLAACRVRAARISAELDENSRRADYEAVLAQDPEHVGALVQLGRLLLHGSSLAGAAEELANRALLANPDCSEASALLAEALQARGLPALAARTALLAAERPHASRACLQLALAAAATGNRRGQRGVLDLQRRIADGSGDAGDQTALAELLLRLGDRQGAEAALERALELWPLSRRARQLRANLAEARGDLDSALAEWSAWLSLCPDDDDAHAAVAALHGQSGAIELQQESLRAALACNPNRRDDQRLLEFLSAKVRPFYADFAIDAGPLLTLPTPSDAASSQDPFVHLLRQRVVKAHRNGTTSDYSRLVIRVLNEAGARQLAQFRLPYYPGEQRARMLACRVHKQDGRVEEPRLGGAGVALPSLQPGDVVDLEGGVDDLAAGFFGDYFGLAHYLPAADGSATLRSQLAVVAEAGVDCRRQEANGAPAPSISTLPDGATAYVYEMDDLARAKLEPGQPDGKERLPLVRFSTFRDWDHFASWWWDLIRGQLQTSEAMRDKVRELTAATRTKQEALAAISRFVSTDVRYEAWEFGVHGYKPYATSVIFERRHGDCKDKALLLCAMLAEAGIEAAPVLIWADPMRSQDDLSLAMVQHFNHCIAYVKPQPGLAGGFIDGTATLHPVGVLPEMDQGARVLVVDEGKAVLLDVPWASPADNDDRSRLAVDLGYAPLRATADDEPLGNAGVALRMAMSGEPARRKELLERRLLARFGPVQIESVDCTDALDLSTPIELRTAFAIEGLGEQGPERWQLPSAFDDEPLLRLGAEPERTTPLLLGVPRADTRAVAYRIPRGHVPTQLPDPVALDEPFAAFTMRWRLQDDQVLIDRRLEVRAARVEPADYPAFREFLAKVQAADSTRILLAKEGR